MFLSGVTINTCRSGNIIVRRQIPYRTTWFQFLLSTLSMCVPQAVAHSSKESPHPQNKNNQLRVQSTLTTHYYAQLSLHSANLINHPRMEWHASSQVTELPITPLANHSMTKTSQTWKDRADDCTNNSMTKMTRTWHQIGRAGSKTAYVCVQALLAMQKMTVK